MDVMKIGMIGIAGVFIVYFSEGDEAGFFASDQYYRLYYDILFFDREIVVSDEECSIFRRIFDDSEFLSKIPDENFRNYVSC